jgi:ComF family protein
MGFRNLFTAAADFFFPPLCLLCRNFLPAPQEAYFCTSCSEAFPFIRGPLCPRCGIPFVSQEGADHLCSGCMKKEPAYDSARAVGIYDGTLKQAIHLFKYSSRPLLAAPLGDVLARQGRELLDTGFDVIMPVPLHARRIRQRGFNQSLALARRVGRLWGVAVAAEGLARTRWTDPQTMLPERQRLRNVRDAFSCSRTAAAGKTVLLVDDVYTSGSTVNECARVLRRNGARRVDVLTLARTI